MASVRLEQGIVEGREMSGVHAFLGIPYAAAPIGDRRWQPVLATQVIRSKRVQR